MKSSTRKNGGGTLKGMQHFFIGSIGGKTEKLWLASYHGNVDKIRKALNKGAHINKKYENIILDAPGWGKLNNTTPLMAAASQGHRFAVELLLEEGADPNIATNDGKTAYDFAKKNDHDSTASLLEETSNTNRSNTSRYNTYRARGGKRRTRKNKRGSRKH
jgi:ankyrin repeat protein